MKGYFAFLKKEFRESIFTYKAVIMLVVLLFFGMSSPLLAKLMPQLISGMDMEGITLKIPEPTAMDSYSQLFKNLTQMGVIVLILVFCGILSKELSKGTLVLMLTKGLSRTAVILSKFTASVVVWTVSLALSVLTAYGYTVYLFKDGKADNLLFSVFCLWLFGVFLLALILLSSSVVSGSFGGLVFPACALFILLFLNIFPKFEKWNPVSLASKNAALIAGSAKVSNLIPALWITFAATVGILLLALAAFRKAKL